VSNLKHYLCRRCKKFSLIFSIIGVAVRELRLLEVEGVCSGAHGRISMTKALEFIFK